MAVVVVWLLCCVVSSFYALGLCLVRSLLFWSSRLDHVQKAKKLHVSIGCVCAAWFANHDFARSVHLYHAD